MAKKAMVQRDLKRRRLAAKYENKRQALKAVMKDENASPEDKFRAAMKLAEIPRNASAPRIRFTPGPMSAPKDDMGP